MTLDNVIALFREGMRLRIPLDGTPAQLVEGRHQQYFARNPMELPRDPIAVDPVLLNELVNSELLHKLEPETGFKNEKGETVGPMVKGYKELGYDGEVADWYVLKEAHFLGC